jgi:hypothetical protein
MCSLLLSLEFERGLVCFALAVVGFLPLARKESLADAAAMARPPRQTDWLVVCWTVVFVDGVLAGAPRFEFLPLRQAWEEGRSEPAFG